MRRSPTAAVVRSLALLLVLTTVSSAVRAQGRDAPPSNPEWTQPFPPFRIIGNIYWVGSYDLSTYLIVTPQGNILINTGIRDTAKQIQASVGALGFKLSDTKILTATHGHYDHAAGLAELKRMTGARVLISEQGQKSFPSRLLLLCGKNVPRRPGPVGHHRRMHDGGQGNVGGATFGRTGVRFHGQGVEPARGPGVR